MRFEQYKQLQKYDRIWKCVRNNEFHVNLKQEEIAELNQISRELLNEEYSNRCSSCSSTQKKRWLKALCEMHDKYEKQS